MSDRSQNEAVLARLQQGPLTALEAMRELGTARLAARVFDLRLAGHTIERKTIKTPTGKWVGQYHLLKGRLTP